jgi:hypothetical protein
MEMATKQYGGINPDSLKSVSEQFQELKENVQAPEGLKERREL